VIGLRVDAARRVLFALTAALPDRPGDSPTLAGRTNVLEFDLNTGRLLRSIAAGPEPAHRFHDLALNAEGDAFITDSASGEIWKVPRNRSSLELLIPRGVLGSPRGIVITPDGKKLFISDGLLQGIYCVEIPGGTVARLPQRPGMVPYGIDGLVLRGDALVGIAPLLSGGRVQRFQLGAGQDSILRTAILECNNPYFQLPTSGVLVENALYYIANSQFLSDEGGGRPSSQEGLRETVILKLKL
jgi:hypothetical protein